MDNSLESRIAYINSRLVNDIKAKAQQDWLKECILYFLEDPKIDNNNLYEGVKEQLCLANIGDSSHKVIPEEFTTRKNAWTFNNSMLLQMQKIIDISEPFYEQWRRLHDRKLDEVIEDKRESRTFQSKKKRMFKLELTDGYKTIDAMEMKHISALNTKLPPGIKILIIGPVPIVNHIIMLKPEHIKIIGGEVEELLIPNAYENVLLNLLKRPTTNTPITNYTEQVVENEKPKSIPKNLVQMQPQNQNKQSAQKQSNFDDIEDEGFDLAMIEAIEEQELRKSQEMKPDITANRNEMIDDDDDYIFAEIDLEENSQKIEPMEMCMDENKQSPLMKSNDSREIIPSYSNETIDLNSIRKRKSADSLDAGVKVVKSIRCLSPTIKIPTIVDNDYPYKIDNNFNFITIDQYSGLTTRDKIEREYAIEASVQKVLRIKATDFGWLLYCQIKDPYSQNTISVRFADEIVTDFAKRTAKEMQLLKIQIDNGQPQLKIDIASTLGNVNDALQNNSFLLCIQMSAKLPADYENVITRVLNRTDSACQTIATKIEKENIPLI